MTTNSVLMQQLFQLMERYRFQPSKKKSQHFLINPNAVKQLVESAKLSSRDTALEIGSGTGFITRALLDTGARVIATELDETCCEILRGELPQERLQIVEGNYLKVALPRFNKVCSAPPYSISSEIMHSLFGERRRQCRIDNGPYHCIYPCTTSY